jgi:HSF-type DNA-binding
MLSQVAKNGAEDLVSWQPHGKAFRVHKPTEFAQTIMPAYFRQTRYKSFQRQLHIYGFHRIGTGIDKGSYWHPMFVKDMESISLRMTRCKIKGALAKLEVADPDFYQAYRRSVTNGVEVVAPAPEVMKMTLPEQEPFGTDIGIVPVSTSTVFDSVLFEDPSLPETSSCEVYDSNSFHQEQHLHKENSEFVKSIFV